MPIMSILRTYRRRPVKSVAVAAVVGGLALAMTGCGATVGRLPGVGEPTHVPAAQGVQPEYPSVAGPANPRQGKPMTAAERAKVEASIARDRAKAAAERRKKIQKKDAPE
jgi:hypothetical protein